jgi:peptide/nickel transport system ATP-binding protein
MTTPVLRVADLRVELESGEPIVEDVNLELGAGEVLGLVGESGSGKTTTALALLGFARPGARIGSGTIEIGGQPLVWREKRAVRGLRGRLVSYVAQDPGLALNPALRVKDLVGDMVKAHGRVRNGREAVAGALASVHLPTDRLFARRFPHQLSGGQQQRVAIATALVCEPRLVVLDEPTTGLDVVTQARILEEVDRLRRERGVAIVYVSHDLAVVASLADRIAVMYAGRIVEEAPAGALLSRPRHPYTRGLLTSVPDLGQPHRLESIPGVAVGVGERPEGCAFAPRCLQRTSDRALHELPPLEDSGGGHHVRCFEWARTPLVARSELETPERAEHEAPLLVVEGLRAEHGGRRDTIVAVADVSFGLATGECLAIVGESGSGKTTIARCVAGLHAPAAGRVLLDGVPLEPRAAKRSREARRRIQIVFQNPNDSLNPRHRVGDAIARPARILRDLSGREAAAETARLLERVRLPARIAERFPGELSGGERQRVAIARALAAQPEVVVCDEITSALDVSVQAAVLELLAELRAELRLALLFITHDLGVVASIGDRVLVLENGVVCDDGPVSALLRKPEREYTRRLVEAAPRLPRLTEVA